MKLIHRLGYFSIGLFFGIIILVFFLSGKKTSCDYFPNARVLKEIRVKDRSFSNEALSFFNENRIDTSAVSVILEKGEVDFGKSKTHKEPCRIYNISGSDQGKNIELQFESCDTIATVLRAYFKEENPKD